MDNDTPRLFGLKNSNRDFSNRNSWGKNKFNSSFPAALGCYMFDINIDAKYIIMSKDFKTSIKNKSMEEIYNINPLSKEIFFAFESQYTPFQRFYIGSLPRVDLVIQSNGNCCAGLEIKLTALPDQATYKLTEDKYACEIVVRPDTIVYLACSILNIYSNNLDELYEILSSATVNISDWSHGANLIDNVPSMNLAIKRLVELHFNEQTPFLMQPIWKTDGKSPKLSENCLDMFVWSNLGLLGLFIPQNEIPINSISRFTRCMIWLYKMLLDGAENGRFDGEQIIDSLSYNTKNDKAFAANGLITHKIISCNELKKPRIKKDEIKNIILGGGQNFLSPERRFDAIVCNTPDLF